jgi:uncharacterized protein (DUF2384 family)
MAHTAVDPTLRTAEVASHATAALGRENAMAWLKAPNPALEGKTPIEILSKGDPDEVQRLDDQLTALEYGMFS